MNLEIVEQLISSVGFPIVISMILLWSNHKTIQHYEKIILQFTTTIDVNTQVLHRILNKLETVNASIQR